MSAAAPPGPAAHGEAPAAGWAALTAAAAGWPPPVGDGVRAGQRFHDRAEWTDGPPGGGPHIWRTLGYHRLLWEPGRTAVGWLAVEAYAFPTAGGPVVQGGLVTALLDAAMGGATWTTLDRDQAFLTADLRVEFLRPSRPGPLVAVGAVLRRTQRVVFACADLRDADGTLLATSRGTQALLPAAGAAGRYDTTGPG